MGSLRPPGSSDTTAKDTAEFLGIVCSMMAVLFLVLCYWIRCQHRSRQAELLSRLAASQVWLPKDVSKIGTLTTPASASGERVADRSGHDVDLEAGIELQKLDEWLV